MMSSFRKCTKLTKDLVQTQRNNSRSNARGSEQKFEPGNKEMDVESKNECLAIESADSETESEGYGFERVAKKGSPGCGDRLTEAKSNQQVMISRKVSINYSEFNEMHKGGTSDTSAPDQQIAESDGSTTLLSSLWDWVVYLAARVLPIIMLSFIYLGFAIVSIKLMHFSRKEP